MFRLDDEQLRWLRNELLAELKRHLSVGGGGERTPPPRLPGNGLKNGVPKRLLTVEEAAHYMGRSKSAVEHLIHRNNLAGCICRLDGRVYVDRVALDKKIDGGKD